jgi:predicted dithiol-disulfide oxidoreductase (DUF899 family)
MLPPGVSNSGRAMCKLLLPLKERGIDLLAPVWNFMDLTPQGRGEWDASLTYGTKTGKANG